MAETLQIVADCNRCGVCCTHGGSCELRRLHPFANPEFIGRCAFLRDTPDGRTTCERLDDLPAELRANYIDGRCDFPDDRVEVG